ncbi:MAG: YitT family protein [Firmicutes bacterium]|nr:YitT family protein [Bacillota bacterium]
MAEENTNTNLKSRASPILSEILSVILGSTLYGVAIDMFLTPSGTVMGGATGIATVLNILFDLPAGTVILVINIPILLIALKLYGIKMLYHTIIAVASTSVLTDLVELLFANEILPIPEMDPLFFAVCGGGLLGAASGILLSHGYTTGGSDLVGVMLHRKFPRLSTGNVIFILDLIVIGGSAIVRFFFVEEYTVATLITSVLYSVVAVFVYSIAIDAVVGGTKTSRLALIVSDKYDEVADGIFRDLGRGVTILHGLGWYSGQEKNVIMCVVKRSELFRLKSTVKVVDDKAFMILADAKEVLGHNFEQIE